MGREENKQIFEDTEKLCKINTVLKEAIAHSVKHQVLTCEQEEVEVPEKHKYAEKANIVVSKKRTYEAAFAYKEQKVCVLNFASASNPGGGVTTGAGAQEECLCRCSTLYFCLNTGKMWDGFYEPHREERNPVHNDDCIYTPDVVVFKTDTTMPELMPEKDWYKVNVITCAAPNLRSKPGNRMNAGDGDKAVELSDKELEAIHEKRMRRILNIALQNGQEVVILGAYGCGAFMNPPEVVARAMKTVVEEYRHAFLTIEFAVYCRPQDETNYKVFEQVLGRGEKGNG